MATTTVLSPAPSPSSLYKFIRRPVHGPIVTNPVRSTIKVSFVARGTGKSTKAIDCLHSIVWNQKAVVSLLGAGLALTLVGPASAADLALLGGSLQLNEPPNALSLPTWAIHISSVVEWITAMALVWQYGEKTGNETWKGLSWGMVPLLAGALCACTWHFFYNSEALEVLVALQAALTVIGNATMCFAAFRVYSLSEEQSKKL